MASGGNRTGDGHPSTNRAHGKGGQPVSKSLVSHRARCIPSTVADVRPAAYALLCGLTHGREGDPGRAGPSGGACRPCGNSLITCWVL